MTRRTLRANSFSSFASTLLSSRPIARRAAHANERHVHRGRETTTTNLSTRARPSELFRASPPWPLQPWKTRSELLEEAAAMPRSKDVRPPLVFVPVLLLLPLLPLTRMGWGFFTLESKNEKREGGKRPPRSMCQGRKGRKKKRKKVKDEPASVADRSFFRFSSLGETPSLSRRFSLPPPLAGHKGKT